MSAPELKVYGWTQSYIRGVDNAGKKHNQSWRCVVAAPTKAAVGRIVGQRPAQLWCLEETGNEHECIVARAAPGTVFYAKDVHSGGVAFLPLPPETWVCP